MWLSFFTGNVVYRDCILLLRCETVHVMIKDFIQITQTYLTQLYVCQYDILFHLHLFCSPLKQMSYVEIINFMRQAANVSTALFTLLCLSALLETAQPNLITKILFFFLHIASKVMQKYFR